MIRLKSELTLADIEKRLIELDSSSLPVDLQLPRNLDHGGTFGISAALSQYVVKWARRNKRGTLRFFKTPGEASEFLKAIEYPHGLISIYSSMKMEDKNGIVDRLDMLKNAAAIVEAMHSYEYKSTVKGPGVFLACFSGSRKEFILPFYEKPSTSLGLRGTYHFKKLTEDILKECDSKFAKQLPESSILAIASLIFELIENTNDHATKDEFGRIYDFENPNIRGLLARKANISRDASKNVLKGDERTALWATRKLMRRTGSTQSILEISVFDYGIGIAKTWLKAKGQSLDLGELAFSDEETVVKDAFQLGNTTKDMSGTGVGLSSVLTSLASLGAAMRLRTGRLCYWQEFSSTTHEFTPVHFNKKQEELPEVPGTLFTLLIPLGSLA